MTSTNDNTGNTPPTVEPGGPIRCPRCGNRGTAPCNVLISSRYVCNRCNFDIIIQPEAERTTNALTAAIDRRLEDEEDGSRITLTLEMTPFIAQNLLDLLQSTLVDERTRQQMPPIMNPDTAREIISAILAGFHELLAGDRRGQRAARERLVGLWAAIRTEGEKGTFQVPCDIPPRNPNAA